MIRIHVFCEGQTEDNFIRELLYDHLRESGLYLNPILVRTSPSGKGGLIHYTKIKPQLHRKCREDQSAYVTTLFDLFRLPDDFPGKKLVPTSLNPFEKAAYLEKALSDDVGQRNFIPNLMVHEFEGLLFTDPRAFSYWFGADTVSRITSQRQSFQSPEHINDGPETAPSKRIAQCCPGYQKPFHGPLIAIDIGIDAIRRECHHFDKWLKRLAGLGAKT